MPKTEELLHKLDALKEKTGVPRTIFAACPNSPTVIRASLRAAKRNNAPIYFAATLNQIDCDGGYTGMTQEDFVRTVRFETERVNFTGDVIIAIDHGGPWLKDKQRTEKWSVKDAMDGVKKSFEAAVLAGYDLIHVDPTVDINVPKGEIIDIHVVAARTVELIDHVERFRKAHGIAPISYEVGTEEVHGGLADETTFDTFISELKKGLMVVGLADVWPCFIVGKVGTDLDTTIFDGEVARRLTSKVRPLGSYIKGHYTDDVANPEEYPLCGMGAANVGPEFTMSEYRALCELEGLEKKFHAEGKVGVLSHMKEVLLEEVHDSHRWEKWLHADEQGKDLHQLTEDRQDWIVSTCCRYIWQQPRTLAARGFLYANLERLGIDAEEIVLGRIERDMDKYFRAFNLVGVNDLL
ncbi:MAG: class II D-tagatose-bisphosphate aldolase, non-catalytic subunit [Bacteroidales bacterium]|jgi:tagatose-1,6-bisphosphate aldolase non-catalytic subunit AgaZ/GatZ|nr:class II D-tagatose-bisphosphate aldolase, non-catalytic subunit [Bacteroidales bacterium]